MATPVFSKGDAVVYFGRTATVTEGNAANPEWGYGVADTVSLKFTDGRKPVYQEVGAATLRAL